jgi:predicted nucleic acid-binding protein
LINSRDSVEFIAPDFLRSEIKSKYDRLVRISKMDMAQVFEAEFQVCKRIRFISEEQINDKHWLAAEKLVADVDPKDAHYVAYSKHFKCKIWSGDKQLMAGLAKKGFKNCITTNELFQFLQE